MKKETKSSVKSDVATGLSSSIGATIGMIIGNAASAEANAVVVSGPEPMSEPISIPTPEPEIEVVAYDTVVNEDGNKMDVAVINIDGQSVAFIDVDMDNVADVYVMDANGDNMLEEEEFVPIRDYSLSMVPFRETVYPGENWMAQEDDYINDANVDDFMA